MRLAIVTALLLAGCTTDDPREGGLLGGLVGLGSGAYQARVDREASALKVERKSYLDKAVDKAELEDEIKHRRSYALDVEREVVVLREQVNDLDAEIAALESEEQITQGELTRARGEVAALAAEIARVEAERSVDERAKAVGADAGPDADPAEFGEPPVDQVSELRAYIIRLQEVLDDLQATRDGMREKAERDVIAAAE